MGFYGLDMDGLYSLGISDYFRMLFGFVNLSELVKYLRVERYLAAKIGTISLVLVRWVLCITVIEVVFHFFLLVFSFIECYFIR